MKTVRLLSFAFLVLADSLFAQDFRKATWGMTPGQVKVAEQSKPVHEQASVVVCKDKVAGFDCYVNYLFSSKGLVGAGYAYQIKHTNDNDYIDDFEKVKGLLNGKYGNALSDDITWKNDLYKDDREHWGMAISLGQLKYQSLWENDRTRIILLLSGDNFEISLAAYYYSLDNWETYTKDSEASESEGL